MACRKHNRVRAGSSMVLVMLAVAVAFLMGLTFLTTSTTVTGVAQVMVDQARARQVAESGLMLAADYVRQEPDWKEKRGSGVWLTQAPMLDGAVSIEADFTSDAPVILNDSSFEQQAAQLANPPLSPPMSGTIGGWEVSRTAMVQTGLTVPKIGCAVSADATQGNQRAFIDFGATVSGSGQFGQTLATTTLQSDSEYVLSVDVKAEGFPPLSSSIGFRLLAGGVIAASTANAYTLQLPALPDELPTPPSLPPAAPEVDSLLEVVGLGASGASTYSLRFLTSASPPAGAVRVELFATSIGVASTVAFDNVRLEMASNAPVTFTATGRCGDSSFVASATLRKTLGTDGQMKTNVVQWTEP